jgi:hypothetical protein
MLFSRNSVPPDFAYFTRQGQMYKTIGMQTDPVKHKLRVTDLTPPGKDRGLVLQLGKPRVTYSFVPALITFPREDFLDNEVIVTADKENEIRLEPFDGALASEETSWPPSLIELMAKALRGDPLLPRDESLPKIDIANKGLSVTFTIPRHELFREDSFIKHVTLLVGVSQAADVLPRATAELIFSSYENWIIGPDINAYLEFIENEQSMGTASLRLARSSIPPGVLAKDPGPGKKTR